MLTAQKQCSNCKVVKHLDDFSSAPRGKFGKKATCKECDAARHAALHPPVPRVSRPRRAPISLTSEKACTICAVVKPMTEYSVSRRAKSPNENDVYRAECKPCNSAKARAWHRENPERSKAGARRHKMKSAYGIEPEDYSALLVAQNGLCAICAQPETSIDSRTGKAFSLSVDHCHDSGRVRGLLCHRCNRSIGLLGDNVDLLRKAIDYLER